MINQIEKFKNSVIPNLVWTISLKLFGEDTKGHFKLADVSIYGKGGCISMNIECWGTGELAEKTVLQLRNKEMK